MEESENDNEEMEEDGSDCGINEDSSSEGDAADEYPG